MNPVRVLMTAGEASADKHAALLIRALKDRLGQAEFYGLGGPEMVKEGFEARYPMTDVAVMGFSDVLPKLMRILSISWGLKRFMRTRRPDIFIPVDLPDFNMHLARYAHRRGIKVLYYIAPQAWAWRRRRAATLARITDGLGVIFPFEEEFFKGYGVNARYVGHPVLEHAPLVEDVVWPPKRVAILPGSRWDEIVRMLPVMLEAKRQIAPRHKDLRWFLPVAPGQDAQRIRAMVDPDIILTETLPKADLAMVKSGTACFEMALKGVPEVICYTTSAFNYKLAKSFITIDHIGMPNIAAGRTLAPELIQDSFTSHNLAFLMLRYINDKTLYQETRGAFLQLRATLGGKKASHEVAQWAQSLL